LKPAIREFDFSQRQASLDVLRGVAILLVLLNHANLKLIPGFAGFGDGADAWLFWRLKALGWTGVDLFFVLSGFLVGGLLMREAYDCAGGG